MDRTKEPIKKSKVNKLLRKKEILSFNNIQRLCA